jgi:hypothetical protein
MGHEDSDLDTPSEDAEEVLEADEARCGLRLQAAEGAESRHQRSARSCPASRTTGIWPPRRPGGPPDGVMDPHGRRRRQPRLAAAHQFCRPNRGAGTCWRTCVRPIPTDAVEQFEGTGSSPRMYLHSKPRSRLAQQSAACNAAHNRGNARMARWLLRARDLSGSDTLALTQEFLAQSSGCGGAVSNRRRMHCNESASFGTPADE